MAFYYYMLIIYAIIHTLGIIIWCGFDFSFRYPKHPKDIYNDIKVNWFGAIFVYIIYFCVLPIYAIVLFIFWLCTVGRRK